LNYKVANQRGLSRSLLLGKSVCLLLGLLSAPSRAERKVTQQSPNNADLLPIHPRPCGFHQEMTVAVRVHSKEQYEARPVFPVLIDKINVRKGDRVKKGQLLISTNTSEDERMLSLYSRYLSLYESNLKVVAKSLKVSEDRRDRLTGLVAKGIVPQSELDAAEKLVLGAKGEREGILREIESTRESVKQWNDQIRASSFYSGIDGIVTDLIVDPQNMSGGLTVFPGTPIARVEKPGSYIADATLIDTQIRSINAGMSATVVLGDGTQLPGKVVFVSPLSSAAGFVANSGGSGMWGAQPDTSPKLPTYTAQIAFARDGEILPSGLMASATLVSEKVSGGRCLPYNALSFEGDKPYIRIFSEGSGWKKQPIEIGRRGRYEFEVKTNLNDKIVIQSTLW
jgi:multidrug efflux pump subunit AcrA (membrane-fusion protein)